MTSATTASSPADAIRLFFEAFSESNAAVRRDKLYGAIAPEFQFQSGSQSVDGREETLTYLEQHVQAYPNTAMYVSRGLDQHHLSATYSWTHSYPNNGTKIAEGRDTATFQDDGPKLKSITRFTSPLPDQTFNSRYVTATNTGLQYFVIDEGTGAAGTVMLLHGWPDTSYMWRYQIPALKAAGFRVLVPDMRGRGRSQIPANVADFSVVKMVGDVTGILDALGIAKAHLVGHDWGAAIAWLTASLAPTRVNKLVVLSVGHPATKSQPGFEQLQMQWYQYLVQFPGTSEAIFTQNNFYLLKTLLENNGDIAHYVQEMSDPAKLTAGFNYYRATFPITGVLSPAPNLPRISADTLGIWSTGDKYLPEVRMVNSQQFVDGEWKYVRVEKTSHWIPLEQPALTNQLILTWLLP